MSRFLLVTMHEDLASHYTTHDGVLLSCKLINGVESVTDLGMIDQTTLDAILRKPEASTRNRRRRRHIDHEKETTGRAVGEVRG